MGRKLALLIATYAYQDEGLRQLTSPGHDAEALAEVLRDPDIAGFDVTILVNEPHHRIGQALGEFFHDRRGDDLTLLYFTGHGLKDDAGRLHLAATDTRRDNLLFTSLPAEQIDRAMSGCMSRRQVLILDCCYSGAFPAATRLATKADGEVHSLEAFQGRGRTVLTASDATQYSFEGDQVTGSAPQSVFTRHLVQGLREGTADLDADGDITLDELYAYVHDRVVAEMPQQRPKRQDNVEGRIVIARNIHWTLPAHLRHALRSPLATDRLGAVEALAHLHRVGNETVRGRAEEELRRLTDDDSISVSRAATAHLQDRPAERTGKTPAPAPAPTPAPAQPVRARPVPGTERWSLQTGGCVRSAPAVADRVVYVGSDTGALYAVDTVTGQQRWCCPLGGGPVRCGPAVGDGLVFATVARTLFAVDIHTGQIRWESTLRGDVSQTVGVAHRRVYVGAGRVQVFDTEDGGLDWQGPVNGASYYQWLVMAGPVTIVGNRGKHVYAVDNSTRRLGWSTRIAGAYPVSGPSALSGRHLYVGDRRGELHALDLSDGHRAWRYDTGGPVRSAPAVADGTVYVGNDDDRMYAFDALTGEMRWRFTAMAPIRSTPALAGATVYFGSDDGHVYAVDTGTGQERWRFPTGRPVASSPAVTDGVVYVGGDDGRLYAVEATG
ncbi:PQQ-binding-like beta-propeller repeat protein [Streptomyces sp. NPDC051576]|uniref:caspase, EACC1-associated type n=1 Tax=Streptomyces sp. NPDC051576 TaxID=3155803 RepID=UPI00341C79BB